MQSKGLRRRIMGVIGGLVGVNLLVWVWAILSLRAHPVLLGTALLAYGFGLRHAVDADHIAAIDNVTRKLRGEGKRPLTVGLFFALGHSLVVILLSLGIALGVSELGTHMEGLKGFGDVFGTLVSAAFLFAIAVVNVVALAGIWQSFLRLRRGETLAEADLDLLLAGRGLLARLFRPLFALIRRPAHMFPIGFLFGLGFDTATEVALLGISAAQASSGVPLHTILVFPALFTAGMTLVDTADGLVMLGAYDWAFAQPLRKLYYNLVVTGLSVLVAVLIGGIETLGLIGDQFGLSGPFWEAIGKLNDNFNLLGFVIVGLFLLVWAGAALVYRYAGIAALEE
jgi:high-affinity nickel-transport protein